jgi:hypothetical protein
MLREFWISEKRPYTRSYIPVVYIVSVILDYDFFTLERRSARKLVVDYLIELVGVFEG